jgi:hypothetical protein
VKKESTPERRLWKGRRYVLTDARLIVTGRRNEIDLDDVGDIHRTQSPVQTLLGLSTVDVRHRNPRRRGVVLRHVRRGAQLAALIELLAADPLARRDTDVAAAARATMTWEPRIRTAGTREAITAIAFLITALVAIATGLHGKAPRIVYPEDDAIYPNGEKKDRQEIVRFMERTVMPWARVALAPIVGSSARVTCTTCHGAQPEQSDWQMPAVQRLPRPAIREAGWEHYGGVMDAQMRNAIYGYGSASENVGPATYMREVVMPGMAALLHRPAYDFTRTYEYNREQFAFGCYHCHKVQ